MMVKTWYRNSEKVAQILSIHFQGDNDMLTKMGFKTKHYRVSINQTPGPVL